MIHVNLFGGPGTGKSTTAAGLFYKMKTDGVKAELVQEYAKELTYSKNSTGISNQLYVTGMQHHKSYILNDEVDYAIHDSPIILATAYAQYEGRTKDAFEEFITSLFSEQDNRNYFLVRDNEAHPYAEYGRSQSLDEAEAIDKVVMDILIRHNIPFIRIPVAHAATRIYADLIEQ